MVLSLGIEETTRCTGNCHVPCSVQTGKTETKIGVSLNTAVSLQADTPEVRGLVPPPHPPWFPCSLDDRTQSSFGVTRLHRCHAAAPTGLSGAGQAPLLLLLLSSQIQAAGATALLAET